MNVIWTFQNWLFFRLKSSTPQRKQVKHFWALANPDHHLKEAKYNLMNRGVCVSAQMDSYHTWQILTTTPFGSLTWKRKQCHRYEVCIKLYVFGKIALLACVAGIKQRREEGSQRKGIEEGAWESEGTTFLPMFLAFLLPFPFPIYACNAGWRRIEVEKEVHFNCM